MATISHKRGDTFFLSSSLEQDGNPIDISTWIISCQARKTDDTLVQDFTVTVTDAASGDFTISATDAETELWPIGTLEVDIEFIEAGPVVSSTETFFISVVKDITRV